MSLNIHDGRTNYLYQEVTKCEDLEDVHAFIDEHSSYFTNWKAFINHLLDSAGYSYSQFASLCGMSRNTIISWCEKGKVPRSREQFIRVGFAVNMSLDELNHFLQRYGKYPRLNPKNIDDAVTMFSICNQLSYTQCSELKKHFSSILQDVLKSRRTDKGQTDTYFSTTSFCENVNNEKNVGIWSIKEDGSDAKQLYNGGSIYNLQLVGGKIYFYDMEKEKVFCMDLDGSNLTEVKDVTGFICVG